MISVPIKETNCPNQRARKTFPLGTFEEVFMFESPKNKSYFRIIIIDKNFLKAPANFRMTQMIRLNRISAQWDSVRGDIIIVNFNVEVEGSVISPSRETKFFHLCCNNVF